MATPDHAPATAPANGPATAPFASPLDAPYRALLASSVVGVALAAPDGTMLEVNAALAALLGRPREALVGLRSPDLAHPDDAAARRAALARVAAGTDAEAVTLTRYLRPDGTTCWLQVGCTRAVEATPPLLLVLFTDVTARMEAESAARETAQRFTHLLGTSDAAHWWTDAHGHACGPLPSWQAFTGQSDAEVLGLGWLDAIEPEDHARALACWRPLLDVPAPFDSERRIRRRDGVYRTMRVRGVPVLGPDGDVVEWVGSAADVTDAREALATAEAERRRLEAVLEALPVGVLLADADGAITHANPRIAELLGGWQGADGIDDYAHFRARFHATGVAIGPEDWALARALTRGETSIGEVIEIDRFDGGTSIILNNAAPVRDGDGRIVGAVVIVADLTAEHRTAARLRELTEELESRVELRTQELVQANALLAESMRHKREFLANMSHELRTPLNAILGFCELLHDGLVGPVNAGQRECLTDVLQAGRHLLHVVDDVLDLAKVEAGRLDFRPEPVDVRAAAEEAVASMAAVARASGLLLAVADASDDECASPATVVTDRTRLRQVLYNFLSNAVKFTPAGGRVVVHVGPARTPACAGGVRVAVADTGVGIAAEDLPRLFHEFVQIDGRSARAGTGLGLALTRRLVESQEGTVGVDSTPGAGSTFWAELPAAPAVRARLTPAAGRPAVARNPRRAR